MVFETRLTACDTADSLILNCSPKNMSVTRHIAHTRKLFNFHDMTPLFSVNSKHGIHGFAQGELPSIFSFTSFFNWPLLTMILYAV